MWAEPLILAKFLISEKDMYIGFITGSITFTSPFVNVASTYSPCISKTKTGALYFNNPSIKTDTVFDLPAPVIAKIAKCLFIIEFTSTLTSTSLWLTNVPNLRGFFKLKTFFRISSSAFVIGVPGGAGILGSFKLSSTSPSKRTFPLTYKSFPLT